MAKDNPVDPIGGEKEYSELFHELKRLFEWNKCSYPEDLAQEAIARGLKKTSEGTVIFSADPKSYYKGIARMMVQEQRKARTTDPLEDPEGEPSAARPEFKGLNETEMGILVKEQMNRLDPEERRILAGYMNGLDTQTNLSPQTLRVRIHRIVKKLKTPGYL